MSVVRVDSSDEEPQFGVRKPQVDELWKLPGGKRAVQKERVLKKAKIGDGPKAGRKSLLQLANALIEEAEPNPGLEEIEAHGQKLEDAAKSASSVVSRLHDDESSIRVKEDRRRAKASALIDDTKSARDRIAGKSDAWQYLKERFRCVVCHALYDPDDEATKDRQWSEVYAERSSAEDEDELDRANRDGFLAGIWTARAKVNTKQASRGHTVCHAQWQDQSPGESVQRQKLQLAASGMEIEVVDVTSDVKEAYRAARFMLATAVP